jgi:hypothetical protein
MHHLPTQSTRLNDAAEGDLSEADTTQKRTEAGRTNAGSFGVGRKSCGREIIFDASTLEVQSRQNEQNDHAGLRNITYRTKTQTAQAACTMRSLFRGSRNWLQDFGLQRVGAAWDGGGLLCAVRG